MIIENLGKVETVKLTDVEPLKKITKGSGVYVMIYMERFRGG